MIIGYSGPYRVTLQDQRKAPRHARVGAWGAGSIVTYSEALELQGNS